MKTFLSFAFLFHVFFASAQSQDSSRINKKRLIPLITATGLAYGGSLVVLSDIWYSNQPRSDFHFFDDSNEWLQLDKAGHATTAFHESAFYVDALKWAGLPRKKAILIGSMAGFLFQSPIEILDGYSAEYGASVSDLAANAAGSLMVLGQYLAWDQIRIQPKFSFHRTQYAAIRPNSLGGNLPEQMLKDYNGQTYWLSCNISTFLKKDAKFPKWINVSLGYGGEGMIYATKSGNVAHGYPLPYRQYYLSFDVDVRHVKTNKKWVKVILYPLNFIHIPFPALEADKHGVRFKPLYF